MHLKELESTWYKSAVFILHISVFEIRKSGGSTTTQVSGSIENISLLLAMQQPMWPVSM